MHKLKYLTILIILVLSLAGLLYDVSARRLAAVSPLLGAAESYSVLAGSIVTNTGNTTMPGDLGISPSIGTPPHYTGFPPGIVGPPGAIHDMDAEAAAAQADNTTAFAFLDQACDTTYPGVQDLTTVSPLGPGTYCADAFLLSGNLVLSGDGVWIFKSASTLTTSSNSAVIGGDPCNVWWRLGSSGTLGTGTAFIGSILALESIHLQTGANLDGRALVQTGEVTLDSNTITGPICVTQATATPTATTTSVPPTATATPTGTTTSVPPTATATPTGTTTSVPPTSVPPTSGPPTSVPPTSGPPTTSVPPTATYLPSITGLPDTGGAPIRNEDSSWGLLIIGLFSVTALVLGIRAYRRTL